MWNRRLKWIGAALLIIVGGIAAIVALPAIKSFLAADKAAAAQPRPQERKSPAVLITDEAGNYGVRLTKQVEAGLMIKPQKAVKADKPRALPPQPGTLNYDNEGLFLRKSRFAGEVEYIRKVPDTSGALLPSRDKDRFIRFGDRIEQGELMAVVYSRDLGEKKAALVDAMAALHLSKTQLATQKKLADEGALSAAQVLLTERQVKADTGAVLTAERTLRMWKLTDDEIADIKKEAKQIIALGEKAKRDPKEETKWARVEIRAPIFTDDPKQVLTIVEKNTNKDDMVDPSVIMFKLADLSKLQIWVNIHEEFLTRMRRGQKDAEVSKLKWKVQIEGDAEPLDLNIATVAPSLDPNNHMLMVIGYLNNPNNRYKVGQFVTATIYVEPEPDTVEIPTEALNEVEGESLVFVQRDPAKPEFMLRRVSVVNRFKDVTFVRSKLSGQDEEINRQIAPDDVKRGRRRIQPLLPDERVITRGVVELTAALTNLATKERIEKEESK
jgi:cobalt-zinc-cadmium efflux system membrane fusion protein